ncbi:MAG: ribosomal protein S19 family protein [Nanoarchaeota archaeon]
MAEIELIKKEKLFRGKKIEELKQLDTREFAKFLKSRQRRWILRNFNVIENFTRRCEKKIAKNKPIRTHKRELVIVPKLVGMTISVYNGKEFFQIKIIEEMLGHRLGEFALTRRVIKHGTPGVGATKSSSALSVK